MFTTFKAGDIASASISSAKGYYCYYTATYNDGTKDYSMRGRLVVVAHDNGTVSDPPDDPQRVVLLL